MRPEPKRPEINVTPLVDVVLVLLIIFMVVIPQLDSGAAVDVPAAKNPDPEGDVEYEPLTVSITAHGAIYFERQPIRDADLVAVLEEARRRTPDRPLQIKADLNLRYARAREVFSFCQDLGFPGVGLEVAAPDEEVPPAG